MTGDTCMQDRVHALAKDPWKNALPLLRHLTKDDLQLFLSAHQLPSEHSVLPSKDETSMRDAITACIRCRGTLREAAHGAACMALLLRLDTLLRRELPLADMVPSAQRIKQSMLQQDAAVAGEPRDAGMPGSSSALTAPQKADSECSEGPGTSTPSPLRW